MRLWTLMLAGGALSTAASAQLGPQTPSPSVGSPNMPSTNMGMDSFSGVPVRSGDNGRSKAEYAAIAAQSRAEAQQWADRAKQGPIPTSYAPQIRDRLKSDLESWRGEYSVRGSDYRAMVAQWLVPLASLDATGWAKQRADWFAARDSWVAAHTR